MRETDKSSLKFMTKTERRRFTWSKLGIRPKGMKMLLRYCKHSEIGYKSSQIEDRKFFALLDRGLTECGIRICRKKHYLK